MLRQCFVLVNMFVGGARVWSGDEERERAQGSETQEHVESRTQRSRRNQRSQVPQRERLRHRAQPVRGQDGQK